MIRPEDKQNFTLLAAEFRAPARRARPHDQRHYDLTAFLPAAPAKIDAGFEARKIFKYLDFGTVQGYDFHGSWEPRTNQQSALCVPARRAGQPGLLRRQRGQRLARRRRAAAASSCSACPYYGQGWTGVTGGGNGLFQPATGPAPGIFAAGTEDYKVLKTLPARATRCTATCGPATPGCSTAPRSGRTTTRPVAAEDAATSGPQGLGGAMMWSLDGDDDERLADQGGRRLGLRDALTGSRRCAVRRTASRRSAHVDRLIPAASLA